MAFVFKVIKNCLQDASEYPGDDADFYLEENNWDNYGYRVTYNIHVTKRLTGTKNEHLGGINIMKKEQQECAMYLLAAEVGYKPFEELPADFVSVCLYREVFAFFQKRQQEEREEFIRQMHLIIDEESVYYEMVKDEECFLKGMLRDATMDNYIFKKARAWMYSEECKYDLSKESFTVKYNNSPEPIEMSFSCIKDVDSSLIPNGMVAFIGANGSGKSTALYKLAKLMYLSPGKRPELEETCGAIFPNNLGVERMILVSYSPFDNFVMPATENFALRYMDEDIDQIDEHFIYCGIRHLKAEHDKLPNGLGAFTIGHLKELRLKDSLPKNQDYLAADFAAAYECIKKDGDKYKLWSEVRDNSRDLFPDLYDIMYSIDWGDDSIERRKKIFVCLSTGYKFFLHSLAYVIAFIVNGSLVLFDEPENHIHPPLLSFMMAQYRNILKAKKSVMFISTHSPVILQEIFSANVYKVKRDGESMIVEKPSIETYGATFGEINADVFNLTTDVTNYYKAFDELYEVWHMDQSGSIEEMLENFENKMGHEMSDQIESYLITKYCSSHAE